MGPTIRTISFFAATLLVIFTVASLTSCSEDLPAPVELPQSTESLAQAIVKGYPTTDFLLDVSADAEKIFGKDVTTEARMIAKDTFSSGEIDKLRTEMLLKHFNQQELQELLRIQNSTHGRTLLRKFPGFMLDWREKMQPLFLKVLSNTPNG